MSKNPPLNFNLMAHHHFDNRFVSELPGELQTDNYSHQVINACWSSVIPTPVKAPGLIAYSEEVAALLDFNVDDVKSPTFASVFSGNTVLAQMQPYATCYGGHQFGHWAGQLGDGRVINLAEIINQAGQRWEIQLKGAGPTPFSRHADGRAVLRSSLREFLCSEAMHHLNIPTTRALCLIKSGDQVLRDMFYNGDNKFEPGAIVCRVAPSFIRFGTFEILAARGENHLLKKMIDFTIARDFPLLKGDDKTKRSNWFKQVCDLTAHLIIDWLRVGFVHGVMNTDNMSILGLTIDYGPYGWLDNYDPHWTPNTTDAQMHRYAYDQQANIAYWNLQSLSRALSAVIPIADLQLGLEYFKTVFDKDYKKMLFSKFGFMQQPNETGLHLIQQAYQLMLASQVDMTCFFRRLAEIDLNSPDLAILDNVFYQEDLRQSFAALWQAWLTNYANYCQNFQDLKDRREKMNAVNPAYILRNYLVQEAIDLAHSGDYSRIYQLMEVIKQPYLENQAYQKFSEKRPEWARNRAGCSMLSCSS